MKELLLVKRAF